MSYLQKKLEAQGKLYHDEHPEVAEYPRYAEPGDCYRGECAANANALWLIDQASCKNCRHYKNEINYCSGPPMVAARKVIQFPPDFSCAGFEPREGEQ